MILKADYEAKTVFEINYDELKNQGIKVIAFDLDSTVMKSKSGTFDEQTQKLFENLKKDFSLLIISNNSNSEYIERAISNENNVSLSAIGSNALPRGVIIL